MNKAWRNKRAVTLLEVVMVLSVIAISFVGVAQLMSDSASSLRAKASAQKLEQIIDAAEAYASANAQRIDQWFDTAPANALLTIPVAKQTAVSGSPLGTPGFQSLQQAGFLPSGFIDQNAAGQSHAVLVKRMAEGLELLVIGHGGRAFSDADLGRIASQIGVAGGAVYSNEGAASPVTQITGAFGAWSYAANAWSGTLNGSAIQPTAGRPVAALSMIKAQDFGGAGGGEFLSRVDTGRPEDTTMSTALNMGNNPISNATSVNVNGTIFSQRQIDSNRYVWSREGLYTEGNIWSRGDISTAGNIAAPHGAVFAGNFCNANNTQCVFGSPPKACSVNYTSVSSSCPWSGSGRNPAPPCPAGFTEVGGSSHICGYSSSGNERYVETRQCLRVSC